MPDLAAAHPRCRFADCRHTEEPDCAVLAGVDDGSILTSRYLSYVSMVEEDLGGWST